MNQPFTLASSGQDDEDFCDNFGTIPLPNSAVGPSVIVPGRTVPTLASPGGTSPLEPLPLLLLLLLSAVLLAKWL